MSTNVEFSKKVSYRIYDAAGVIQNMAPQCNLVVGDEKIQLGLNVWRFDEVVSVKAPECNCCKNDTIIRLANGDRAVIYDKDSAVLIALNTVLSAPLSFKTRVNSSYILYSDGSVVSELGTPVVISDHKLIVGSAIFDIRDIERVERTGIKMTVGYNYKTCLVTVTQSDGDKIDMLAEDNKVFDCLVKKIKGGDK